MAPSFSLSRALRVVVISWTLTATLCFIPLSPQQPLNQLSKLNSDPALASQAFPKAVSLSTSSKKLSLKTELLSAPDCDCIVVGSGVTGSSLAFHLTHTHNISNVILFDQNADVGGNCISKSQDTDHGQFVFDLGPNSAQPSQHLMKTVYDLNLTQELVLADGSLPRFVYWDGDSERKHDNFLKSSLQKLFQWRKKPANLHALPMSIPKDLFTFNLLSWPGRIRAALGAVGLCVTRPQSPVESIKTFVTRHLGEETFTRIIAPFCSGVYAGDPDKLCMSSALKKIHRLEDMGIGRGLITGAVVRMSQLSKEAKANQVDPRWPKYKSGQLMSFKSGLQTLPRAVAKYLTHNRVRTGHSLSSLVRDPSTGLFTASFLTPSGPTVVTSKSVALTTPAGATGKIIGGPDNLVPSASKLSNIYHPPVAAVVLSYKNSAFRTDLPGYTPSQPLRGFGILFPRKRGVRSLGIIFNSSLFPNRAPKGYQNILTYIGGTLDPGIASMTEDEIAALVDEDIRKVLLRPDVRAGDFEKLGVKKWKSAIPQYYADHAQMMAELETDEARVPGLYIDGNWRSGVAFGDCVTSGIKNAENIANFLLK